MKTKKLNLSERLIRNIVISDNGCWLWVGYLNRDGYGILSGEEFSTLAHRISYFCFKGQIPKNYEIDHLCRVRNCINPDHLESVTHKVNTLRGETLPAKNLKKTHCPKGHPYIETNIYLEKSKYNTLLRRCKTCQLAKKKRLSAKRKLLQIA